MDNKEVKINSSVVKMFSISKTDVDELFIYKHKIEEFIAKENDEPIKRMTLDDFINRYLNLSSKSFFYSKTQEVIAYSLIHVDDEYICFYVTNGGEDAIKGFTDEMDKIDWKPEDLPTLKPIDMYEIINDTNFFVIDGKMKCVYH